MSKEITLESARQVAKNVYFERSFINKNPDSVKIYEETLININEKPMYYIFNIASNKGFVIVAADDRVFPVLAYSFFGNFNLDNQPPSVIAWMKYYQEQIYFIYDNNDFANPEIEKTWSYYLDSNFNPQNNFDNVAPLLTTTWDQGCYYNAQCPSDASGPCGRVYAGCVATAMAQVMKYHNYPSNGNGSHGYYSNYGYLSVNFSNATYNWASMPNSISGNNAEVAKLLFHLGVSVDMQYSPEGSGAYSEDARDALVTYFDYSNSASMYYKNNYSNVTWQNMLRNDLDASRPIYYDGSGTGGHAFVCDGYQGTDYFHFNWGWSGSYNGYFYLNDLTPGSGNFTNYQGAILGVEPNNLPPNLNPPTNLTATLISDDDIQLSWIAPDLKINAKDIDENSEFNSKNNNGITKGQANLNGYNIYRNNILLNFTTSTSYLDENLSVGYYSYSVSSVYEEGESEQTTPVMVQVSGVPLITISPTLQDFGIVVQNQCSSTYSFLLQNTGNAIGNGIVLLGGPHANEFQILSGYGDFSLDPGETTTIFIEFCPTSAEQKSATLLAEGISPCNSVSASLIGECIVQQAVTIEISDVIGNVGESNIPVEILLDNFSDYNGPISSMQITISYDASIGIHLNNLSYLLTNRTFGFNVIMSVFENGIDSYANISLNDPLGGFISSGTGSILEILFNVDENAVAGTSSQLCFTETSVTDLFGNLIPTNFNDCGLFEIISSCECGDVNCDGQINIFDLQIIINVILGNDTNLLHFERSDLTGDGLVNIFDLQCQISILLYSSPCCNNFLLNNSH